MAALLLEMLKLLFLVLNNGVLFFDYFLLLFNPLHLVFGLLGSFIESFDLFFEIVN